MKRTSAKDDKLKIEKNIPIPPVLRVGGVRSEETRILLRMKPGDSVLMKGESEKSVRSKVYGVARDHDLKFTTRRVEGGIRVWRK